MRRYPEDNPVFPAPVVEASGGGKLRGLRLLPGAPVIVIAHVAKGCLPSPPPGTFCNLDWPTGTSDSLPQCGAPCLPLSKARPVCRAEGTKSWLFFKKFKRPASFGFCFPRTQQSLEESYFHQIHFIFKGTSTQGTVQKSASKTGFLTAEHWLETISILRTPPGPGVGREKRRGRLETQSNLGKSKQDSVRINYLTASPNLMLTGEKKAQPKS